jgi:hypothetical protein
LAEHTYENNHEINGEDVHNGGKTYAFASSNNIEESEEDGII